MSRPDESQPNDSGVLTGGASSSNAGPAPGGYSQIGRYKVLRELGRGAMGVVYEAVDPKIGRKVALKVLHDVPGISEAELEEFRSRFFREARTAGMLSHPNIVVIHDVDSDEKLGISFMAMECLKGQTIYDLLRSGVRFTTEQAIDICIQVAEGLDHAHRQGVVHRDVKPANLMLLEDGTVKITDFGIAKISTSNLTRTGQFLGTPNYMSPEQVIGHVIDGRSDLFSLGIIVYELLTGEKPFMGSSLTTITYQIVNVDPIEPSKIRPGLAKRYDAINAKLLRKAPDERYATGKDVAEALRQARDGQSADAAASQAPGAAPHSTMISAGEATHVAAPSGHTMGPAGLGTTHAPGAAPAQAPGAAAPARKAPGWVPLAAGAALVALLAVGATLLLGGNDDADAAEGPSGATAAVVATLAGASVPLGASGAAVDSAASGPLGASFEPAGTTAPSVASTPTKAPDAAPRPVEPRAAPGPRPATGATGSAIISPSKAALLPPRQPQTAPAGPAGPDRMAQGSATVTFVLQHKLKDGTVTVAIDGRTVLNEDVASQSRRRKDTVTAEFKVPDGRHDVRVCINSTEMKDGQKCATRQHSFVMNRTTTIRAEHFKPTVGPHKFTITSIE